MSSFMQKHMRKVKSDIDNIRSTTPLPTHTLQISGILCIDQLWCPPSLLSNRYQGLFRWG